MTLPTKPKPRPACARQTFDEPDWNYKRRWSPDPTWRDPERDGLAVWLEGLTTKS